MQFQPVLDDIVRTLRPRLGTEGRVADYIPALARVPVAQFGIALRTCDGQEAQAGDSATPFSIQSISKLFALTLGMRAMGETLWERSASDASPRATRSTRWCSWRPSRARRATPSSTPGRLPSPTGW